MVSLSKSIGAYMGVLEKKVREYTREFAMSYSRAGVPPRSEDTRKMYDVVGATYNPVGSFTSDGFASLYARGWFDTSLVRTREEKRLTAFARGRLAQLELGVMEKDPWYFHALFRQRSNKAVSAGEFKKTLAFFREFGSARAPERPYVKKAVEKAFEEAKKDVEKLVEKRVNDFLSKAF